MYVVQNQKPKRTHVSEKTIHKKFKSDFSVLFETKRGADVVLVAGNQEFSAHKAILMARSDVFAEMFENQMRESIENRVEIKDINPEVLEIMLLYIYTGNVRDMDKIGSQLMAAADKYGLDQLKTICSRHLTSNMSLNSAIETLIISKLINDSNLKRSALEFIRDNSRDVIQTKDWINLQKNNSELFNEIFLFSTNNHSIEAKIRWNLTQMSKFKTKQMSPITEIHGLPWRISVWPMKETEIGGQQRETKYFGVFICCGLSEPSSDFSCNARRELRIISIKEGIPDITKKVNETYKHGSMEWGFRKFECLDTLLDPNNGYIRDDTIILEAKIIVDPPKGVTDSNVDSDDSDNSETEDLSSAEDSNSAEELSSSED